MTSCINSRAPLNVLQGQYSKITFRSPLYVGGSPSAYWLVRATGTNRGFVGCIQSLTINSKATDIRPWPLGKALSGADIGEGPVVGFSLYGLGPAAAAFSCIQLSFADF